MHNGLNSITLLASTYAGNEEHLKHIGPKNMVYLNTRELLNDFSIRLFCLKEKIINDIKETERVGVRLQWVNAEAEPLHLTYTPAPEIDFVIEKLNNPIISTLLNRLSRLHKK